MQIVIDIPDNDYKSLVNPYQFNEYLCSRLKEIVRQGTPLPKGHGRLIDADELELDADWDDYYDGYMAYSESMIKYAPTIIDADKE